MHFQNVRMSLVFRAVLGCRKQSCNFFKRELHDVRFSGYFTKCLLQLFQNTYEAAFLQICQ